MNVKHHVSTSSQSVLGVWQYCGSCGMVWDMTTETAPATAAKGEAWVPDDSTFGARLALIRQRFGWNITEAARECGMHAESWRLWEQAGREPRRLVTICMAIASRTSVDFDWLLRGPSSAMLRQRSEATRWYVETVLNGTKSNAPEGRVIAQVGHGDGRLKSHSRRSARQRNLIGSRTAPIARSSVN